MSPRPTPDETRRPDVPCRPLKLADGQHWGFALPARRLAPLFVRENEPVDVRVETGHPLEIRRRRDALRRAQATGTPERQYEAFLALAVALLRRAHDLTPPEARGLLTVADEELPALVAEIIALAGDS